MTRWYWLGAAAFVAGCGAAEPAPVTIDPLLEAEAPPAPDVPPTGQLPEGVTPERYEVELALDPVSDRFSGKVKIRVSLEASTSTLWMHGEDLDVSHVAVITDAGSVDATWEEVQEDGLVRLRPAVPVGPGVVTLEFAYEATFGTRLTGLYRVEVDDKAYAFTQFEPISARRAFPCFDEPRFKVPFSVSLVVPSADEAASNGPITAEETLPDGKKRVHFAETSPLPTYLVAFAVGPFDVVAAAPIEPNAVRATELPFRGLAISGKGPALEYALKETRGILAWLEDYFGREYPFDKLDIVAVPDFSAGAMENVGLVTFREWLLLVDEETATEGQKRAFAYVMAHELAHMWFGNLVTMPWWDDLWLNEAFATWMGNKVVRHLYPAYEADIAHVQSAQSAMSADSLVSARRIRQPIESNHDIENAFDRITYSKGGAVLEMFERWMGEEEFQAALRGHMERHAYGTATADDLLTSLQAGTEKLIALSFRSFLSQPGVPLVDAAVQCEDGGDAVVRIAQRRFLPVGSSADAVQTWSFPVCVRFERDSEVRTECSLVDAREAEVALGPGCPSWVMPNAEASGYYRFSLAPEDLQQLVQRGWRSLSVREQLALADSLRAAFVGATVPAADVLAGLEPLAADGPRQVAAVPMGILEYLDDHVLTEADSRASLRRYGERLYRRRFRRIGWGQGGPESDASTSLLRSRLVSFLGGVVKSRRIRREARRRAVAYLGYRSDGELHPEALDQNLADVVLRFAVQDGDLEFFEAVLARFVASRDATVRQRLLGALSSVRDAGLAERVRALSLDERLRTNEIVRPLAVQMGMSETRDATWSWLRAHFDELAERLEPGRLGDLPWLTTGFCSAEKADEVEAFFGDRIGELSGGPRNLAGAVEVVRLCAARAEHHRQSAAAFFSP